VCSVWVPLARELEAEAMAESKSSDSA
jgi:hypothetical protein